MQSTVSRIKPIHVVKIVIASLLAVLFSAASALWVCYALLKVSRALFFLCFTAVLLLGAAGIFLFLYRFVFHLTSRLSEAIQQLKCTIDKQNRGLHRSYAVLITLLVFGLAGLINVFAFFPVYVQIHSFFKSLPLSSEALSLISGVLAGTTVTLVFAMMVKDWCWPLIYQLPLWLKKKSSRHPAHWILFVLYAGIGFLFAWPIVGLSLAGFQKCMIVLFHPHSSIVFLRPIPQPIVWLLAIATTFMLMRPLLQLHFKVARYIEKFVAHQKEVKSLQQQLLSAEEPKKHNIEQQLAEKKKHFGQVTLVSVISGLVLLCLGAFSVLANTLTLQVMKVWGWFSSRFTQLPAAILRVVSPVLDGETILYQPTTVMLGSADQSQCKEREDKITPSPSSP